MLSSFFAPIDALQGWFHALFAILAIVLGPIIFLMKKGTVAHRFMGKLWMGSMLIVNIAAWLIYDLTGGLSFFHLMSLLNLAALLPSMWFIWRYGRSRNPVHLATHAKTISWAYFGLCAAGAAQIMTTMAPGFILRSWQGSLALGVSIFITGGVMTVVVPQVIKRLMKRYAPEYSDMSVYGEDQ